MPEHQVEYVPYVAAAVLRRFVPAFALAALLLTGIIATIYRHDAMHQQRMLEQESEHVVALHEEFLQLEFRTVQSDLLYLATQSDLRSFLSGSSAVRKEVEREYVNFALNKGNYDQIRCLDTGGHEILRVNYRDENARIVPAEELQSKANRYYYQQALSLGPGDVFISPFDLNVERGQIEQPVKPVIRFVTPVYDEEGTKRGFLVLNYLGANLLAKLRRNSTGFRGDVFLTNPMGEYLLAQDSAREWGWLLGHDHSFRSDFPDAWNSDVRPAAGQITVNGDLFTFQQISPGRSVRLNGAESVRNGSDDPTAVIVVACVSSATATAHSRKLLRQLLMMCLAITPILTVLLLLWARSGEIRRVHERHIVDSEARLRQLSSLLLTAQETERRMLSRELHDELGQQVTALSLDLRSLAKSQSTLTDHPLLERAIAETDHLLQSVHNIATRVRPGVLDDLGLHDAVESFLSEFQERMNIRVTCKLSFERQDIPATIGINVYRILQEALANVAAHARTDEVDVVIETDDQTLSMSVCDSGIGFDEHHLDSARRLGILGMRERTELLEGRFQLKSAPGTGTQIRVEIPLGKSET